MNSLAFDYLARNRVGAGAGVLVGGYGLFGFEVTAAGPRRLLAG